MTRLSYPFLVRWSHFGYTKGLLSAIPSPDPDVVMKPILKGEIGDYERIEA